MKTDARFDDALPRFARAIQDAWGSLLVQSNFFLRDASGRLTFILLDESHSVDERHRLGEAVAQELNAYVDGPHFAIATPEELFDDSLRDHPDTLMVDLETEFFTGPVRLVDRRIVGGDWLRAPAGQAGRPLRLVFGSLKGGVGRTTALCVVAAEFAKTGRRVLAIDMDLEAPGLGTFLLSRETLPDFGLLDFLVESEIGQPMQEDFFTDLASASWLSAGLGRVDVIPAIGKRSITSPHNVLAKIARAYLADGAAPTASTFQDRMSKLLDNFCDPTRYDLVLIDARAGLHETTASALFGLGADVLLFGLDQSQTYEGYTLLFSHLAMLPPTPVDLWRERLTIVQGKASVDARQKARFAESMRAVVDSTLNHPGSLQSDDAASLRDTFEVHWDDSMEDHLLAISDSQETPVISVYEDPTFRSFDPVSTPEVLSGSLYAAAYAELIDFVDAKLKAMEEGEA